MDNAWLNPVQDTHLGTIQTLLGISIDLRNPQPQNINITDLSVGLANTCRWGGQIKRHYSVAQHSVLVCLFAPTSLKRAALLHDAAEAYIHDLTSPLKGIVAELYKPIESAFNNAIFNKYGEPIENLALIKEYDQQATLIEHMYLRENKPEAWHAIWKEHNLGFISQDPNPMTWVEIYLNYCIQYKIID